ncbi:two-component system, sensor histidine kinase YesM [Cohnella sp. OV330]|uniref:sensor histidine kinase n=1 Tax=Cohnella sp. OV330 TaxID=1855288 RepID=UPI0008E10F02|nr:sensor histidine kinase [Cohnella sp. OV330]SFB49113.1 two-component system, sensor histidine kinase YesM [Cohnella sp. OV330]
MRKPSLARSIFVSMACLVIASVASVAFFSYRNSSVELRKQNEQHLIEIVSNVVHHTDLYLNSYERAHLSLVTNGDIRSFLDAPPADDYERYEVTHRIKEQVIEPLFLKSPEIMTVFLIDYNGNYAYYPNPELRLITDPLPRVTLEELEEETDDNGRLTIINNSVFSDSDNQLITLARKVYGGVYDRFKGILAIEIRADEFSTLWKGINLGQRGFFAIVDSQGRFVYNPDKSQIGQPLDEGLRAKMEQNQLHSFVDSSLGEKRMFVSLKSAYTGWNLMVSIPTAEIRRPIASIRYSSILVGAITLLLALAVAYRFGRTLTKPIQIIKNGMRQTERGNWVKIPKVQANNELDELIDRYNLMVTSLSELMEKLYRTELSKKDAELERQRAELQSLQLQINPHFLYNTLENIMSYAVIQQSSEITEIVDAMALMFRYSIQTYLEETAIVNELKHVLNYMTIMKHRIGREFELDVRIPPAFFLKKIARLTLQPLIENVFQHAFADGFEEYHYIRLDAWLEDDSLVILLEDNGVGIAPARLALLQAQLEANQLAEADQQSGRHKRGIGMMNVHRRIQLVFGVSYGLRIESVQGEGTKVYIRLPDAGTSGAAGQSGPTEGAGEREAM